jgi:hypothetical protein
VNDDGSMSVGRFKLTPDKPGNVSQKENLISGEIVHGGRSRKTRRIKKKGKGTTRR